MRRRRPSLTRLARLTLVASALVGCHGESPSVDAAIRPDALRPDATPAAPDFDALVCDPHGLALHRLFELPPAALSHAWALIERRDPCAIRALYVIALLGGAADLARMQALIADGTAHDPSLPPLALRVHVTFAIGAMVGASPDPATRDAGLADLTECALDPPAWVRRLRSPPLDADEIAGLRKVCVDALGRTHSRAARWLLVAIRDDLGGPSRRGAAAALARLDDSLRWSSYREWLIAEAQRSQMLSP